MYANTPDSALRELLAAAKQALESLKDLSTAYPNDPTFVKGDGYADETMNRLEAAIQAHE